MKQKQFLISKQLKIRRDNPSCVLVFDPENDFFYEFNDTGSEIFLLIERKMSSKEILTLLKEKYKISSDKIEKELNDFIRRLIKLKIIHEKK